MDNIMNHGYRRKNGMIYLNLINIIKEESRYTHLIKQHFSTIYFKCAETTRIILYEESCNAILQLENLFNIFVLKVLHMNPMYSTQKLVDEVPFYIADICKTINLNFKILNDMKIKLYIYTSDKLNINESKVNCEKDLFETILPTKMNDYIILNLIPTLILKL